MPGATLGAAGSNLGSAGGGPQEVASLASSASTAWPVTVTGHAVRSGSAPGENLEVFLGPAR